MISCGVSRVLILNRYKQQHTLCAHNYIAHQRFGSPFPSLSHTHKTHRDNHGDWLLQRTGEMPVSWQKCSTVKLSRSSHRTVHLTSTGAKLILTGNISVHTESKLCVSRQLNCSRASFFVSAFLLFLPLFLSPPHLLQLSQSLPGAQLGHQNSHL